ncbi:MAG TPA: lytic murein transglycosylase B [Gallionellaceae bacterium]|nr:lytic murein transglycosylase B [Gallionellaceae bacterium]
MMKRSTFALIFLWLFATPHATLAAELPGIPQFIDEMVAKHQFKRAELEQVFRRAEFRQDVIDAITTPATLKPWLEYRASFVNPKRVSGGMKFWVQYASALQRAEKIYGVPQEIIIAVIGVETLYGRNAGNYRTLDALTTLAFDYPKRLDFFRGELEQYLLLAREQSFDLLSVRASYAGALGIPQFMPSNYRRLGVDFNHDGKIDLLNDPEDAIGSVANYLNRYGWISGEQVAMRAQVKDESRLGSTIIARSMTAWASAGVTPADKVDPGLYAYLVGFTIGSSKEYWFGFNNFAVITTYNNSTYYAMSVFQLAEELRAARNAEAQGVKG